MAEAQEQYDYHKVLDAVWEYLVDELTLDPVLQDLEVKQVFRRSKLRDLREEHPTTTKRISALLQLVKDGGHTQYEQFKGSLGDCGQERLVETIEAAEKGEYKSAAKKKLRTEEGKLFKDRHGESPNESPLLVPDAEDVETRMDSSEERRGNEESSVKSSLLVPGAEDVKKWTNISKAKEIKEHFATHGLKNIRDIMQRNMNEWKEKPLNVAITGDAGTGKSSLINALRNIERGKEGAAKVDETECTTVWQPYFHPEHKNFVLWDIPGVGTKQFPKNTYLEKIEVDKYDFFMIVMHNRFTENDLWLANEIRKRNKNFYFLRTKVDVDMDNRKRCQKRFDEKEEFKKLKSKVRSAIESDYGENAFYLFLISNNYPHKYDFPTLLGRLLDDIPVEKRLAMVFSLKGLSNTLIKEKASALKSRIWMFALVSGGAAAISVPGLSTSINVAIILGEILFYRSQFALDDDSLRHLAHMRHISLEELKKEVKFKTPTDVFTEAGLARYVGKCLVSKVIDGITYYTLPVAGIVIACTASGFATMMVLENILDMMKQDAHNILLAVTTKDTAIE